MDNKNFYDWVMSHEKIYSLLYSPSRIDNTPISEQLFEVKTKDLDWNLDHNSFVYVWGYPGPDYNLYTIETYGKGWAFLKKRFLGLGKSWIKDERCKFLNVKIMNIRKDLLRIEVGLFY